MIGTRRLERCNNTADLRRLARRRLPDPMFHYLDGGADDEVTLRRNIEAFDDYELLPNQLVDVETVDLRTRVLGQELALPFFLAPTGMSRLFHHEAELAVARAAERFGTLYTLSTMGTARIEDVASAIRSPKMFQIYVLKDREITRDLVERCKESGFEALCVTVDTAIAGNRERDKVTGMSMPPRFGLKSLWSFATHPYWSFHLLTHSDFKLANIAQRGDALSKSTVSVIEYVNSQFDRTLSWDDIARVIDQWQGPFAIKGLQTPADAKRAVEIGASTVMISNHGGRQLDGTPAPIDCLVPMRDAVGDALELIVDGGIRRGTHVLKALALGADACSIARPYLYGLAAGGQAGVERALELLRQEVERDLALLGCTRIEQIDTHHVQRRPTP